MEENCFEELVKELTGWHGDMFQAEIRRDNNRNVINVYICGEIPLKKGSIIFEVEWAPTRKMGESKMTARLWGYETSDPEVFTLHIVNLVQNMSTYFQDYKWILCGNGKEIEDVDDLPPIFDLYAETYIETLKVESCVNDVVDRLLNLDAMISDLATSHGWLD